MFPQSKVHSSYRIFMGEAMVQNVNGSNLLNYVFVILLASQKSLPLKRCISIYLGKKDPQEMGEMKTHWDKPLTRSALYVVVIWSILCSLNLLFFTFLISKSGPFSQME